MNKIPPRGSTYEYIRCHGTVFSGQGDLAPGITAPLPPVSNPKLSFPARISEIWTERNENANGNYRS